MDFAVSADHRENFFFKSEEKTNPFFAREVKKAMEHESDGNTNYSWCTWNGLQGFRKKSEGSGDQRKNRDHTDYRIVMIC